MNIHHFELFITSHGAGRTMGRKAANEKFNRKDVNRFLREVMAAQNDLVTKLGQFDPRLVRVFSLAFPYDWHLMTLMPFDSLPNQSAKASFCIESSTGCIFPKH
jgi:tRNA-splicing ligase RtcB